ncbi:ECF transporter S component [uncultured Lactobacillus sp.]|uniref:ECF transporter S component n=1 Tax=uncultured Lactobacillus sp. TaxID=153152 RepID=UPI00261CBD26|nr:ECF transporter S component [uncultured Lactobacillus sp.]
MTSKKVQNITIGAIFVAILIIQSFVPYLGYIRILPALPSITIIPLTVAIAGGLLGTGFGTAMGLVWGVLSLILAYTQPGDMVSLMLFQNPFIAIVPRVAAGFAGGMISLAAKEESRRQKTFIFGLSGLAVSLINTLLVITLTSLFFANNPAALLHNLGQSTSQAPLIWILLVALGMNGVVEAIFTGVVTPIIVMPLRRFLSKKSR